MKKEFRPGQTAGRSGEYGIVGPRGGDTGKERSHHDCGLCGADWSVFGSAAGRARMNGTTPAGAATEREASEWVRGMFGRIAGRYDLANHLLSFNLDRYWRAYTVKRVRPILTKPGARVLDLCCGTGDLLLALESERGGPVWGSDFCHPMLTAASAKIARKSFRSRVFESDALQIPMRDGSLDLVTVAFGFRNLANYSKGLAEMRRVLRPGLLPRAGRGRLRGKGFGAAPSNQRYCRPGSCRLVSAGFSSR